MWFIGVEVEQQTSALPPKKNPGSAPGQAFEREGKGDLRYMGSGKGSRGRREGNPLSLSRGTC